MTSYIVKYTSTIQNLESGNLAFSKGFVELKAENAYDARVLACDTLNELCDDENEEIQFFQIVKVEEGSFNYTPFRSSL